MKIRNLIKDSLFAKSFNLAKSNPGKVGLMVLFDISFLASFYYILPLLLSYTAGAVLWPQSGAFIYAYLLFDFIYRLLQIFVYSFFKYSVLDFIKSLFQKTEFSFRRLGQFYLLNIILIFPLFITFNFVLGGIKEAYRPYFFIITGIPIFLFLYAILSLAHSFFNEGNSLKNSLRKSFSLTFGNMKSYRETIGAIILAFLVLGLLFLIAGYLIRVSTSGNYLLYLKAYAYFKTSAIIIVNAVIYFIILINRILFYSAAREAK
ncbi:hypothetical protein HYX06_02875 [Candidatus Woesearchaeota archaeon]|nr:hypothetical protein [Candidatus Woesearchaeota archaeon]